MITKLSAVICVNINRNLVCECYVAQVIPIVDRYRQGNAINGAKGQPCGAPSFTRLGCAIVSPTFDPLSMHITWKLLNINRVLDALSRTIAPIVPAKMELLTA